MHPTSRALALLLFALVLAATPGAWGLFVQGPKLLASDASANSFFGNPVATRGARLIVGAQGYLQSAAGSAYVFERGAISGWVQVQKLLASDGATGDDFGHAVDIQDDTAVVGATGHDGQGNDSGSAYVFQRGDNGTWLQTQEIFAKDVHPTDGFGQVVALSNTTLVITAMSYGGSAYVFEHNESSGWPLKQKLLHTGGNLGDGFGQSAAINNGGDRLVVGAPNDATRGQYAGAAYVFERGDNGTWVQAQKLLPGDGAGNDEFGTSVSASGDRVVIGARLHDLRGTDAGSAYVFERSPTGSWSQTQELLARDAAANDWFGTSVAISGDAIVIGAPFDGDNGRASGSAYWFERNAGGTWSQAQKLLASDGWAYDSFGYSVALDGRSLVVGSSQDDDGGWESGSVYPFVLGAAPVAVIAPLPDFECQQGHRTVTLDGSSSFDPEGDAITYSWSAPGIAFDDATSAQPTGRFPLGLTRVTLKVTDTFGLSGTAIEAVRVVDTLPPTIRVERPVAGEAYALDQDVHHGVEPLPIVAVGPLTVLADAEDQCGIAYVHFASSIGANGTDTLAPYSFVSDPPVTSSGQVTVVATAFDLGAHTASSNVGFIQAATRV